MSDIDPSLQLVGRDVEMSRLEGALDTALSGRTCTVFVCGQSGVGKSRLLAELATLARDRDVSVLSGGAIDVVEGAPFWPLQDALRRFLRKAENAWAAEVVRPWQPYLDALLPRKFTRGRDEIDDGGDFHRELPSLDVLLQVITTLAAHAPLVVTLDDMQWADRSTRTLLTYLLATLIDEPVLLAIAYRRGEGTAHDTEPLHDLAMDRVRSRDAILLTPAPLTRAAVAELLPAGDSRLVDEVMQRSGGNALFVEEIVRSLRDGRLSSIPDTLRELVRARVRALPEAARSVLNTLSVGDDPVSHQLLASVADVGPGLLEAIRVLVGAGLATVDADGEGYRLCHGIVRDVLVADLLPGERHMVHRRYADVIEASPYPDFRTTARLAVHWRGAGERQRALAATITAAEDAERAFAYTEAQDHWLGALTLCARAGANDTVRADVTHRAARAARLAGDTDQAVSLISQSVAALGQAPAADAAMVHSELGQCLSAAGREQEAAHAHARAVALLPQDADPQSRAIVLLERAAALAATGQYRESRDEAHSALAVAEEAGLDSLRARILPTLGFSLAYLGQPEAGLEAMSEGLHAAQASGVPHDIACAYLNQCNLLCGPLNRMAEGIDLGRRAITIVQELGLGRTFGVTLQSLVANALFRIGEWDAAGELVDAALAVRPTGSAAIELRLARCRLLVSRVAFDAARRDLDALETLCSTAAGPRLRIPVLTLRAGLAMWQQQPALARRYVAQALDGTPASSEDVWVLAPLVWHGFRAEADAVAQSPSGTRAADRDQLARLNEWMARLEVRAESAAPQIQASVRGYRRLCDAESARADAASDPDRWERAALAWEENLHPYPSSYARFRQAEALFGRRARAAGAPELLTSAYRVAQALGARSLAEEMEALARRAGVVLTPPPAGTETPRAGPRPPTARTAGTGTGTPATTDPLAELTKREHEVLAGVAEGRSNRQIARTLFISDKTVSVHVSHILTKLGVSSRVQAAMVVQRLERSSAAGK